ncbi:LAME_0F06722g1_1 [Lachancea meyersii CBS 8951]|uniref:LAME_0F06722g1_1 n=1 Tax=Lachancea meyersii CBS 8951 TaxID=1266667 RepID=A0A1G4JTM7_9SACH|nr:LAME_0F06722g1_1 [Lachancea meyersii CBS 8951]
MEALKTIVGTEIPRYDCESSENLYESFLEHAKDHRFQVDRSSTLALQELETKSQTIKNAIEATIPPLQTYFSDLNNNFKSLTHDLSLVRGKSLKLNELLSRNSKDLAEISPLVNDLVISPEVINQILKGKINYAWVENIAYVRDKQEIYSKYVESGQDVPADFAELKELLEVLESLIVERSKRLIVSKVKLLRDQRTVPSQKIQRQLLEVKEIFQFLSKNNYSLALELRQAYAYTMRWYYKQFFGRYIRSLTILQFVAIDSNYVLGRGLSSTSNSTTDRFTNYFSGSYKSSILGSSGPTDQMVNDYFQIEKRLSVLTQEDNTVMVSQIAENNSAPNFLEVGFKNLNLALLDNCSVEFSFLTEFFQIQDNGEDLRGILEQIFQPTFDEAMEYTKRLITPTFDMFGVLISIWISHHLKFEAQRRLVPVFDDFLNGQLMLLWPKFQQLVDFQCESLRKVPISVSGKSITGRKEESDPSTTTHELTVQFSKFLTSILMLSMAHKENIDERSEPLYNSIIRIRNDFETIMTKCSKKTKYPERFLALNYTYLLNVLQKNSISQEKRDQDGYTPSLIFQETKSHLEGLVEAFSTIT